MAETKDITRRDAAKVAGAAAIAAVAAPVLAGAPAIIKARAATNAVKFGMIGTGSRGTYLLKHLKGIDTGTCVAICDITDDALNKAVADHRRQPEEVQGLPRTAGRQGCRRRLRHHAALPALPGHQGRAGSRQARLLREEPGLQARGGARPARPGSRAPEADPAGGPAAPLQRDVPGRQADDRKGPARRRHLRPGAVAPQPRLEDEEGRPQPADGQLAPLPRVLRRTRRRTRLAPDRRRRLDVRHDAGIRHGHGHARLHERRPRHSRQRPAHLQVPQGPPPGLDRHPRLVALGRRRRRAHRDGRDDLGTQGTIHITIGDDNNKPIGMWFREPTPPATVEAGKKAEEGSRSRPAPRWFPPPAPVRCPSC